MTRKTQKNNTKPAWMEMLEHRMAQKPNRNRKVPITVRAVWPETEPYSARFRRSRELWPTQRAQRSKKFDLDRNFQSRSKFLIPLENFNLDVSISPQKIGPRWVARSKISFSIEIFNLDRNLEFFWSLGPLGTDCSDGHALGAPSSYSKSEECVCKSSVQCNLATQHVQQ